MIKLFVSAFFLAVCFLFLDICTAQTVAAPAIASPNAVAPDPIIVATISAPSTGIMGWILAHGGFQAVIAMILLSTLSFLSVIKEIACKFDGVAPGADIPPGMKGLTFINKAWVIVGKIVDFLGMNKAH